MQKLIVTAKGTHKRLRDEFGVSQPTVRDALSFRYNSDLCRSIRQRAMQLGGRLMTEERTPAES